MGFGDDWKAALEHTKNLAPPPGEKPWLIFDIARYSEDFVEKMNAITLPPLSREVWRLAMQTPERQLINPFFTGGELTRVSYPVDTMTHDDKLMSMRGNTPHFNFATVHHELIPGHHLQAFLSDRFNPHRAALQRTPFWREGWALYWELQLWDRNFPRNNPDKIGMLFWRLHRAARIVFSLNYHLGRWTPQQAVDFLVDRVGHERANAEGEVRRTTIDAPLYQVAYMIGGLQFRALYRELVESGRMTAAPFHDAVLLGGYMPVELVRARSRPAAPHARLQDAVAFLRTVARRGERVAARTQDSGAVARQIGLRRARRTSVDVCWHPFPDQNSGWTLWTSCQLEHFLAVVEEGTFTRAAERLFRHAARGLAQHQEARGGDRQRRSSRATSTTCRSPRPAACWPTTRGACCGCATMRRGEMARAAGR